MTPKAPANAADTTISQRGLPTSPVRSSRLLVAVAVGAAVALVGCSDGSGSEAMVEAAAAETAVPWSDVPADGNTVMVFGTTGNNYELVSSQMGPDGVEIVELAYSETLEMSDPRASGTTEYTVTLHVPDTSIGGTWVIEDVSLVNDGGQWVGYGEGAYIYTDNMPDALTANETVITGEMYLTGTGDYEGLRLHLYFSSDGVLGSLRPVE